MNRFDYTIQFSYEFIKNELTSLYPEQEIDGIAAIIFQELFDLQRHEIQFHFNKKVKNDDFKRFMDIVSRLKKHEPVQYILGNTEFYDLRFNLTPAVLIPRPETEELVRWIIEENRHVELNILDIGTGSGCIAIALKKNLAGSKVYASDVSASVIEIAKKNADKLDQVITLFVEDITNKASWIKNRRYDIIVSNPPYIPEKEKKIMGRNVTESEPGKALFVPDDDPLLFYRHIAEFGLIHLDIKGKMYLEIHERFGEKVKELLSTYNYNNIVIRKDINGKDRMVRCEI